MNVLRNNQNKPGSVICSISNGEYNMTSGRVYKQLTRVTNFGSQIRTTVLIKTYKKYNERMGNLLADVMYHIEMRWVII